MSFLLWIHFRLTNFRQTSTVAGRLQSTVVFPSFKKSIPFTNRCYNSQPLTRHPSLTNPDKHCVYPHIIALSRPRIRTIKMTNFMETKLKSSRQIMTNLILDYEDFHFIVSVRRLVQCWRVSRFLCKQLSGFYAVHSWILSIFIIFYGCSEAKWSCEV
jgi:hypothetical protein